MVKSQFVFEWSSLINVADDGWMGVTNKWGECNSPRLAVMWNKYPADIRVKTHAKEMMISKRINNDTLEKSGISNIRKIILFLDSNSLLYCEFIFF